MARQGTEVPQSTSRELWRISMGQRSFCTEELDVGVDDHVSWSGVAAECGSIRSVCSGVGGGLTRGSSTVTNCPIGTPLLSNRSNQLSWVARRPGVRRIGQC